MTEKPKLIYLASPYSHKNPDVSRRRFEHVSYIAGKMITDGLYVYCPIAHSHPIAKQGFDGDWTLWKNLDLEMIRRCDELWITPLDGWEQSIGVTDEVAYAKNIGLSVQLVPSRYLKL
jgi:hypothetical protein